MMSIFRLWRSLLAPITTGALLVLLSACSAAPDEPGILIDGERLAVVDMHLHTGAWELMTPWFQERLAERVPRGFKWTVGLLSNRWLKAEGILRELDKAGIEAGGVFALYSAHTTGLAPNEFVAGEVAQDPQRLFGFASPRVDRWNLDGPSELAKLEQFLTSGNMIGVKLAHAHQQIRFDDERFYAIYELAGRLNKPVYLHTATSPNPGTRLEPPYTDPYYLEDAIRRYPETIFILGHAGWDSYHKKLTYTDACIDLAQRYDNVFMEPGALGARRAAAVLPDFVARIKAGGVIDRLIYGSDGPQIPGYLKRHLESFVTAMEQAGYSREEMAAVLAGNFKRVFQMETRS